MSRTRSNVGRSLAAFYDLEGGELSSAAELQDDSIVVTHDLGAQTFSERARLGIRTANVVLVNATAFSTSIVNLPELHRILGWCVFTNTAGSVDDICLSLSQAAETTACPLWTWDAATGTEVTARFEGSTARIVLLPGPAAAAQFPQRDLAGFGFLNEPENVRALHLRGMASAGGGGAVVNVRLLIAFYARINAQQPLGGFGPLPSW